MGVGTGIAAVAARSDDGHGGRSQRDAAAAAAVPVPIPFAVEKWHEHQIHIAQHKKWANSDLAVRLFEQRPDLKQLWGQHLVEHEMAEAQDLQFQMMLSAPPVPGGAPGAGQTMSSSNRESGNPADVPSGAGEGAQGRGPE